MHNMSTCKQPYFAFSNWNRLLTDNKHDTKVISKNTRSKIFTAQYQGATQIIVVANSYLLKLYLNFVETLSIKARSIYGTWAVQFQPVAYTKYLSFISSACSEKSYKQCCITVIRLLLKSGVQLVQNFICVLIMVLNPLNWKPWNGLLEHFFWSQVSTL